jgi:PAS domain S-box-containing protein
MSNKKTIDALENSELRFRALAETASDAIININQKGHIIFWNRAASRIFGYSVDEIYGQSVTMLMPQKYRERHKKRLKRSVKNGKSKLSGKTRELIGLRKNGEEFPLGLSLSIWKIGAEVYYTGIVRDISRRKKMELDLLDAKNTLENRVGERTRELLQANETLRKEILDHKKTEKILEKERRRLFSVLDQLPASVHLLRPDHTILFANRYFKQHFGEELKKPCYKILHGEDKPCRICNAFEVFQSGIAGEYEEMHADERLYRVYNYPFTDMDGSSLILQLGIDITEQKKAEEALRKSEERFRVVVSSIDDTVFTLDRKQRFLEIYGNLFDRLGISTHQSLNKTIDRALEFNTDSLQKTSIEKALRGENVVYEWSAAKKDERRYIQNSISPIFDSRGKIDGVVGVARDMTTQKQMEKKLVETEKLMTVAEMSAMISHEFRNSLTSVRMILELQLESTNLNTSEQNSLSVALSSINHMENIVTQLLNFSRPNQLKLKAGNLNSVVQESIDFTYLHAEKKQIVLKTELSEDLPPVSIDKNHMREALVNLILNAVQAISLQADEKRSRKIIIRTDKHQLNKTIRDVVIQENSVLIESDNMTSNAGELILSQGEICVLITVEDTGIGIKPENIRRIFKPFYTTATQGGTGLGLSMVKRTVNAHQGIINVESEPGKGSIFYIYLPLNMKDADE